MKIISVQNNKGGVGKSVSVGFISQLLAYLDKRVLVVDLDPQSNLTMMLGAFIEDSDDVIDGIATSPVKNISDLFIGRYAIKEDVESCIHDTIIENIKIIPSSPRHANTLSILHQDNKMGNINIILKKALATVKDDYDYILIDSAPTIDALTTNSLYCSDLVLTPVEDSDFSLKGLRETIRLIQKTKEQYGLDMTFGGAFLTRSERNTNSFKIFNNKYHSQLGEYMLNTSISKDVKVKEISSMCVPILSYCPNTSSVIDYSKLIIELHILDDDAQQELINCITE
ncbi:chromosome partitioning protein ParA [Lachnospiraceae bacterium]|nr:chromosome partitioning protein ParA [Lachnospiraceae bacterium]GKH41240.1 chromosome partitioning protein ParA [Lachnospiraceae bacterium]